MYRSVAYNPTNPAVSDVLLASNTPTLALTPSTAVPATYGQPITLTATLYLKSITGSLLPPSSAGLNSSPLAPTGTVTFKLYGNSGDTGTPLFTDTETLSGGTATSKGYAATATGTGYWVATYNGDVNFNPSPNSPLVVNIGKATPAITWATPTAVASGTALSSTQLDAASPVAGSFNYSPASGKVLTAGSQMLTVTFTPQDAKDYTTATDSVMLTVKPPVAATIVVSTVAVEWAAKPHCSKPPRTVCVAPGRAHDRPALVQHRSPARSL